MRTLYMLSGALNAIAIRDFSDGSFFWCLAALLGLVCFVAAEYMHGAQQRRLKRAWETWRERRGLEGQ